MKIKSYEISKTLLLIVGIGIFVVALAGLLFVYLDQVQEKNDLQEELDSVNLNIKAIQLDITSLKLQQSELEDDIAENNQQTTVIQGELSTSLKSSELFDNMLMVAGKTDVHLTVVSETGITSGSIGSVSYKIRTITFTVDGSASNIYDFVDQLSKDLGTSILNSIGMSTGSNTNERTTASMQLTTYSYKSID